MNDTTEDTVMRVISREVIVETLRRLADHLDKVPVDESNIDLFKFKQMDKDGHRVFELILECFVKPEYECGFVIDWNYTEDRSLYMK